MALPTPVLSWDFTNINLRKAYVTLNDATSYGFFKLWRYLIDTMGWTVKYTCDGTTGPTSSTDHTDRLTTQAKCATRASSPTGTAQSFGVATDGNGVDHLFDYLGVTDDAFTYTVSWGGLYVPASTSTWTPTATDQANAMTELTWVGATTSGDRIFSMCASSDKKNFRMWVYTAGVMQREIFAERCSSTVVSALSWTDPLVVGNRAAQTTPGSAGGPMGAPGGSTQGSTNNAYAKVGGTVVNVGGGGEGYLGGFTNTTFTSASPQLNGGGPIVPLCFATSTSLMNGKLGNCVDSWYAYVNGITDATPFGTSPSYQFMHINGRMVPWDGNNPLITN